MSNHDLIVRGDLVLENGVLEDGYLAIRDGHIAGIGIGDAPGAGRSLDYRGMLLFPGAVDAHVHTLSEPAEGIESATMAAAAGGVTTVIDMPYDVPEPIYSRALFDAKVEQIGRQARIDVGLYATIRKNGGVPAIPELIEAGALGFKFSLFETDPVRFPRIGDGDLMAAFELLASTSIPIVVHAELGEIIDTYAARIGTEEAHHPLSHGRARPIVSETAAEAKALELAFWSGARLHLAHVTHPHGFALIDWYRSRGGRVSGETCIHYLALCEEDVVRLGTQAKVNPPIRDRAVQEGLWDCLRRGLIASISSDHAPWMAAKKERSMMSASSGAPGLETLLPVTYTVALQHGLGPADVAHYVCAAPADIYGLGARKGRLRVGADADFTVLDPSRPATFDATSSYSVAKWSPFHGMALSATVHATYLRGTPVYLDGAVVAEPGNGRWLRPDPLG